MNRDERREATAKVPNGRRILEAGYELAGLGVHRDSDPLEDSNFHVGAQRIMEAVGMDPGDLADLGRPWDDDDDERPLVAIAHFGHWAVGWIDELVVRSDSLEAVATADDIAEWLEDYPVLDEIDWSIREWEADHPDGWLCYSDEPDCPCEREPA